MNCELCQLDYVTRWYRQNPFLVVLECKTCGHPMVVLRRHTMKPTPSERLAMTNALFDVANEIYGHGNWKVRKHQRTIKDHIHWHAVPL